MYLKPENRYTFRAEPPRMGHYREYVPGVLHTASAYSGFQSNQKYFYFLLDGMLVYYRVTPSTHL